MAETVHLFLKANGTDIQGESTQTSLGREGSIECFYFQDAVRTARERGTAIASGRRTYEELIFHKRVDMSSPLIMQALARNEVIEAEFKFFRPNPAGDGTTQHFFTIAVSGGRIASVKRISPNAIDPASSFIPPYEEVGIVFADIRWVHDAAQKEFADTWANND